MLAAFGTPENLCGNDDAVVARINELLKKEKEYNEANSKAEQCRKNSLMYDSELRALQVFTALKTGYNIKLREQEDRDCACADDKNISSQDYHVVVEKLTALCIAVAGPFTVEPCTLVLQALFHCVNVEVVIGLRLNEEGRN